MDRARACTALTLRFTLHPAPCTLHPTPYILHPAPYTLHYALYALHPIPYKTSMFTDEEPLRGLLFHQYLGFSPTLHVLQDGPILRRRVPFAKSNIDKESFVRQTEFFSHISPGGHASWSNLGWCRVEGLGFFLDPKPGVTVR